MDNAVPAPPPDPDHRVDALRGGIPRWAKIVLGLAGAFIVFFLVRPLILPSYHIPSMAMSPTIAEGDRVLANALSTNPERGEVIVFDPNTLVTRSGTKLISRVIALGGETIEFRDGQVFVDGLLVEEPYLAEPNSTRARSFAIPNCDGEAPDRCVVPAGHVFVMGDNRTGSQDSRTYGPVPVDNVSAIVFMKVMPLGDIGGL